MVILLRMHITLIVEIYDGVTDPADKVPLTLSVPNPDAWITGIDGAAFDTQEVESAATTSAGPSGSGIC